jgi:hypothetical protein
LSLALFDPRPALVQYVMTAMLYPPVAWAFAALNRAGARG